MHFQLNKSCANKKLKNVKVEKAVKNLLPSSTPAKSKANGSQIKSTVVEEVNDNQIDSKIVEEESKDSIVRFYALLVTIL